MMVAHEPMAYGAMASEHAAYHAYSQGYASQYVNSYAQMPSLHASLPGAQSGYGQASGYQDAIPPPQRKAQMHPAAGWPAGGISDYVQSGPEHHFLSPRARPSRAPIPMYEDAYAQLAASTEALHLTPRANARATPRAFTPSTLAPRTPSYGEPSPTPTKSHDYMTAAAYAQTGAYSPMGLRQPSLHATVPATVPAALPQVPMVAPAKPTVPVPVPLQVAGVPDFMPPHGGAVAAQLPQCHWAFTVRKQELKFHRFLELTWLDKYYFDNNHQIQRLGFRFSKALDPTLTAQSLKLAIEEYPVAGSKVVLNNGKTKFHYDMEGVTVQLVHVEPEMLDSMQHLEQLCDILCPRSVDQKQNALFSAFLFKTQDTRHGSVLICGFQHTMGDAMSYGLFLKKWSESYEQLSATSTQEEDVRMPPEVFSQYSLLSRNYQRAPNSPLYRHFSFSDEELAAIKREATRSCKEGEVLSTNDILCAQCAVALAPFRYQQWGEGNVYGLARVFILVETRGRCVPTGAWGNHVVDVVIDFQWHELLQGTEASVVRAARKIRATLKEQMALLESDLARFNSDRANRREVRKLFCWNSWARVGEHLRSVQFRTAPPPAPALIDGSGSSTSSPSSSPSSSISHPLQQAEGAGSKAAAAKWNNLQEMRWFNASWFPDPETVVVEPAACVNAGEGDTRIVVHVASPLATADAELESLQRMWPKVLVRQD